MKTNLYKVQRGDTLESIAKKLNISREALRRHHNTYCDLEHLIEKDLQGIREVHIPSDEKIIEIQMYDQELAKIFRLPSSYLNTDFYFPNYEVTEHIKQDDKDKIIITYDVSIAFKKKNDKGLVFEVQTHNFKKDKQIPDDKISLISLACMKSISPIQLVVLNNGKLSQLYDHDAIINKFESNRKDFEDFFIGEIYSNYINKFYSTIKNEVYIFNQIRSTLLYQLLFPERKYLREENEWKATFYVVPNSFPLECKFNSTHHFEDNNTIKIKGTIDDNYSLQEILKGVKIEENQKEAINGEVELYYTLSEDSKMLEKITAEIVLWNHGELYLKHFLTLEMKNQ